MLGGDTELHRRQLLAALGAGATVPFTNSVAGASAAAAAHGHQRGQSCDIPKCIDGTLGYTGLTPDVALPSALEPDHEVQLRIRPRADAPVPEFFFEPTGLYVERGDVVKFNLATPEHNVMAYHPQQGRQRRVPTGVPWFSSPVLAGGTFWLYQFDVPGVYDLFCAPHELFGMAMRVVVSNPTVDFGPEDEASGLRPPALTAGLVLADPALDPEAIAEERAVLWDDLEPRSKRLLISVEEPSEPSVVASFSPPSLPENIAADADGTLYLSLAATGEILRLGTDGSQSTVATLDLGSGEDADEVQFMTGIAVDLTETLYVALASFDEATHGVWRVSQAGETERLAAFDLASLPNDILVREPRLLVSDSTQGGVWAIEDGEATPWVVDELLAPDESVDLPVGANGLAAARDGTIYVANTNFGRVVRVPVNPDGSAGTPETFVEDPALVGVDGIAFDVEENLYAAVNAQNTVVRVTPDGGIETVLTADDAPLDFPSDVLFGTAPGDRETLYVANFAVANFLADPATANPSLVSVPVDAPGLPVLR